MPPKNRRQNQQKQRGEEEGDEPFQAVILADSYDEQFLPISHEMPRVKIVARASLIFGMRGLKSER